MKWTDKSVTEKKKRTRQESIEREQDGGNVVAKTRYREEIVKPERKY